MTTLKPPFRAEDMDGLYRKVIKGSYSKIGDHYSKQLAGVIKMMLQVNPTNRPSADSLLHNISWKADEMGIKLREQVHGKDELLKTIRAHKNLHYLTDRLPKSNYEGEQKIEHPKKGLSNKQKTSVSTNISLRGLNLPALDRVIVKNNHNKLPVIGGMEERKHHNEHRSIEGMLRIEGRSHGRNDYELEERRGGGIDRDIKAELRKIYNLRSSPKKSAIRRKVQLPRIH